METMLEKSRALLVASIERNVVRRLGVRRDRIVEVGDSTNPARWSVLCPECHQRRVDSDAHHDAPDGPDVMTDRVVALVASFEVGSNVDLPERYTILTAVCEDCGTLLWAKYQHK